MDATRSLILVVLALLVVAGGAVVVAGNDTVRGEPDIEAYAPETAFVPGEEATLEITLNNRGHLTDRGQDALENDVVTARSTTVRIDDSEVPFTTRTGEQPIGDVGEGPTAPIGFTVVPDEDAEPGVYEVPVVLEYEHTSRAEIDDGAVIRDEETVTETVHVEVEITDRARFAVVDVDADVQAGSEGVVNVTLRNVGNDTARNASLSMTPVDPDVRYVSGADSTETFFENWTAGSERTVSYRLAAAEDATARPSTIEFSATFWDGDGADAVSRTVRAGVTPLPAQSFSAEGLNSTLRVDDDGTFEVDVTNEGPRDVSDVVVVFDNEAPALEGHSQDPIPTDPNVVRRTTQVTVGDLAAGESATVAFEAGIRADAAAGPRTLTVVTRYRDDAGNVALSDPLDVTADVAEEREQFSMSVSNPEIEAGSTATYEVDITNTGDEPVTDLQAKLFADDPVDAEDDEAFVTELGPGETTTVAFTLSVDDGAAAKAYAVSVDVRYDDADGDSRLSDAFRLPVEVTQPSENGVVALVESVVSASPLALAGGVGVVLLLGGGVGYWQRRRLSTALGRLRGRSDG